MDDQREKVVKNSFSQNLRFINSSFYNRQIVPSIKNNANENKSSYFAFST